MNLIPYPAELQTVRKTPWNSSLPPSSEYPHAKAGGGGNRATPLPQTP
jgi:hypothetical protein